MARTTLPLSPCKPMHSILWIVVTSIINESIVQPSTPGQAHLYGPMSDGMSGPRGFVVSISCYRNVRKKRQQTRRGLAAAAGRPQPGKMHEGIIISLHFFNEISNNLSLSNGFDASFHRFDEDRPETKDDRRIGAITNFAFCRLLPASLIGVMFQYQQVCLKTLDTELS